MLINLGLSISAAYNQPYSAVANAYFERMSPPPTPARKRILNRYINALLASGVWGNLDALYIMAAHDDQAARLNAIQDTYNMTAINSPSFTADLGFQGNGSSSYLQTGFNPSSASSPKFTQDSASFGFWSLTELSASNQEIGASANVIVPATPVALWRVNNSGSTSSTSSASSLGFFAAVRRDSSNEILWQDGAQLDTSARASSAIANSPLAVCARNTSIDGTYTTLQYGARRLAMAFVGAGLSNEQLIKFHSATLLYLQNVGAVA